MTQYWGGGGDTRHFFLLTLYNFKNIGGGDTRVHRPPCSVVPENGDVGDNDTRQNTALHNTTVRGNAICWTSFNRCGIKEKFLKLKVKKI